ncbi:GNAT family N-acetyltransferase [Streptomyces sp. CB01580]|uniref:GNAT family N-acetyltransferase n=1 Tax=Streptomyces sp. CB01580 TaxID=1703933 RepID=UPI001F5BF471|nr:GNAT family N-acetyltransferase [Streptomyces sp. CB01580]
MLDRDIRWPPLAGGVHTAAMDRVTLETGRLVLRAFTPADVDAVYETCQDEDIQFYTPVPYRRADAEKRIGEELPAGRATDKNHTLGAFRGTVAPWSVRTACSSSVRASTNSATGRSRNSVDAEVGAEAFLAGPGPVIAQALGYHDKSTTRITIDAGAPWKSYAPGEHTR